MDFLFSPPMHKEEWAHNKSKLLDVNKSFPVAQVKAVSKGPHSLIGESDKARVL